MIKHQHINISNILYENKKSVKKKLGKIIHFATTLIQ